MVYIYYPSGKGLRGLGAKMYPDAGPVQRAVVSTPGHGREPRLKQLAPPLFL